VNRIAKEEKSEKSEIGLDIKTERYKISEKSDMKGHRENESNRLHPSQHRGTG
jgi:hypothetical protein